jgi:hypothetical protein
MGYPKITHVTFHFTKGDWIATLPHGVNLIDDAIYNAMKTDEYADGETTPGNYLLAVRIHKGADDPGRAVDQVYLDENNLKTVEY